MTSNRLIAGLLSALIVAGASGCATQSSMVAPPLKSQREEIQKPEIKERTTPEAPPDVPVETEELDDTLRTA